MRNIRVLVVSGFSAFFKQGGGEAEAASLRHSLELHGYEADLYGPNVSDLEGYDVVIFFSCHPSGLELLETCKELSIKIIFWPNYWIEKDRNSTLEEVNLVNALCALSDKVVFKSNAELLIFKNNFNLDSCKILKVNWFVEPDFFKFYDVDRFKKLYDVENYILSVGLIEPVKNQLALIKAVNSTKIKLVLIGGFRKKDYFDLCRSASNGNVLFIPHLPADSPILKSAYAGCDLYIEVSFDPPGRSALEAACFGKSLILSDSDWAKEIFFDKAKLVSPDKVDEIKLALDAVKIHDKCELGWKEYLNRQHYADNALKELYKYLNNVRVL